VVRKNAYIPKIAGRFYMYQSDIMVRMFANGTKTERSFYGGTAGNWSKVDEAVEVLANLPKTFLSSVSYFHFTDFLPSINFSCIIIFVGRGSARAVER
jgi:hypothetical protein